MGYKPTGNRKYEVTHLWEKHHEILRLLTLGYKADEVAKRVGVSSATVSNVRNSQLGRLELQELKKGRDENVKELSKEIQEEALESFVFLQECREGKHDEVSMNKRIQIALNMLDRCSASAKVTKSQSEVAVGVFSKDELEQLKENARKADKAVDADYEVMEEAS